MDKVFLAPLWAQLLIMVPLGFVLATAAVTDWRERKIYNWLTYPTLLGGLVVHTIAFGWSGLLAGFLTAIVVLLIGLLILPLGWLGGGDIKLLAAVGAAVGPAPLFEIFFYSLIVGLLMGLSLSLVNGYLLVLGKQIGAFLKSILLSVATQSNMTRDLESDERGYLPFAIPIFFGAVFATTDAFLKWPLFMDWIREVMAGLSRF